MSVGEEEDVAISPPAMRQCIAWGFARRAMMEVETAEAERLLLGRAGADRVRNVKVRQGVGRQAPLQLLPGWRMAGPSVPETLLACSELQQRCRAHIRECTCAGGSDRQRRLARRSS